MYLYYLNWFLLLCNGKVKLTKYWKVKEIQSFNHLFYKVVEKSIWEWVGFLKMIQRYLCKKGLFERTFLKHTFFWNITFLHGLAEAQFQKNKIKNKKCIKNRLKVSCEQSTGMFETNKDCRERSPILEFAVKFYFL